MPPDEELPPYPGNNKQGKVPARDPLTLTRQQQAEARRVQVRLDSRQARENVAPSARRPTGQGVKYGGKKLTANQERVLDAAYGDRIRSAIASNPLQEGERWEVRLLNALRTEKRPRSDSVESEELTQVLKDLGMDDEAESAKLNCFAPSLPKAAATSVGPQEAPTIDLNTTEVLTGTGSQPDTVLVDPALSEVLKQLDEEDKLPAHGDSDDMDYEDDGESEEVETEAFESEHENADVDVDLGTIASSSDVDTDPNPDVPTNGSFLEGFPMFWASWEKFAEVFDDFQEHTFQMFSCRTSTSIAARNRTIAGNQLKAKQLAKKAARKKGRSSRLGGTLLPESWTTYSKTFRCTHGMPFKKKGKGKRSRSKVRSTECSARVNIRVRQRRGGNGFHLVVKASGTHNHLLTEHQWFDYVENRRIEDPQLRQDIAVMSKAGAKPRGILAYLRSKTGKRTVLKDVHNILQDVKRKFRGGSTDADRTIAVLDEFMDDNSGNTAEVIVDSETNVIRVVTFQSARQKRLFAAFPEIVLVDSTHGTNANRYKLFSFAVHDVFGRGQYVQHALVRTEEKPNLALAIEVFKKNNPEWANIQVVMTDKALHEKEVLHEAWPNARQLLCRWHVETWLKKQCSRLGDVGRTQTKQLKAIMKGLVNANSQQDYDNLKCALLETVGNDTENLLYKSFMQHWDTTTDEWVMFKRGGVPHLMNNTNNRLESKWGRVKEVIDGNFTIDELVSMLITLQDYAEERYLAEFHRVGSRPPMDEDPELAGLALQLSDYAFKMVAHQHKLATGPTANYDIEVNGMQTTLINPMSGETHKVDAQLSSCDCIFVNTCLLPCRHVMYVRSKANFETVIPPMRTFASRWIVQSIVNNIDEGPVTPGGLNRVNCKPIPKLPPVDRDTKYMRSKQLAEKIVDVVSLQPSRTYRLAMTWMEDFYTAVHTGKLEEFTGHTLPSKDTSFSNLPEISDAGNVTISQTSFGDNSVDILSAAMHTKPTGALASVSTAGSLQTGADGDLTRNNDISRQTHTPPPKGSSEDPITFASPPKRRGMSRRAEKKEASKKEMEEARHLMLSVQEGKKLRAVKLSHMEILSGPYTRRSTMPLVEKLNLPTVEVNDAVS